MMKKYIVTLTQSERSDLEGIVSRGSHRSQKVLNALILLGCDEDSHQDQKARKMRICQEFSG
jgi:NAD-dependent oxidoreductase involved in siderophore biosynthesis